MQAVGFRNSTEGLAEVATPPVNLAGTHSVPTLSRAHYTLHTIHSRTQLNSRKAANNHFQRPQNMRPYTLSAAHIHRSATGPASLCVYQHTSKIQNNFHRLVPALKPLTVALSVGECLARPHVTHYGCTIISLIGSVFTGFHMSLRNNFTANAQTCVHFKMTTRNFTRQPSNDHTAR